MVIASDGVWEFLSNQQVTFSLSMQGRGNGQSILLTEFSRAGSFKAN
jgi:hypothetical protein